LSIALAVAQITREGEGGNRQDQGRGQEADNIYVYTLNNSITTKTSSLAHSLTQALTHSLIHTLAHFGFG